MTPTGLSDKLLELIAYEAVVIVIQRVEIARDDVALFVHEKGAFKVKDTHIIKTMTDNRVDITLHVGGDVDLVFLFELYDLLAHTLAGFAKYFILEHLVFFGKPEQSEKVQSRIFLLPEFERHERNKVTGEYPIDTVILLHNLLAQHPSIFVFALQVDGYAAIALEVIFGVDKSSFCIQTVPVVIDIIPHNIQTGTNGDGDVGTLREELKQEL